MQQLSTNISPHNEGSLMQSCIKMAASSPMGAVIPKACYSSVTADN